MNGRRSESLRLEPANRYLTSAPSLTLSLSGISLVGKDRSSSRQGFAIHENTREGDGKSIDRLLPGVKAMQVSHVPGLRVCCARHEPNRPCIDSLCRRYAHALLLAFFFHVVNQYVVCAASAAIGAIVCASLPKDSIPPLPRSA